VLAGSAEFKAKLHTSELFDPRLAEIVVKTVDVSYGGENGFNQAIELSADALTNVKFVREMKLLATYFAEISMDSGKFCFGVRDTLYSLESGAVEDLIVYEALDINRYTLKSPLTGVEKVIHLNEEQEKDSSHFVGPEGEELEIVEKISLLEWFANKYQTFGARLQFVTNKSQEGSQFCKGFGGIGALLRYKPDFNSLDAVEEVDDLDYDPDEYGLGSC
jgi:peptide chain release factor subunit 1